MELFLSLSIISTVTAAAVIVLMGIVTMRRRRSQLAIRAAIQSANEQYDRFLRDMRQPLESGWSHKDAVGELERFFAVPGAADAIIRPGVSGPACNNIRIALRNLNYEVDLGSNYDIPLGEQVRKFQADFKHTSYDGQVGPGTRQLLTRALYEHGGPNIFSRLIDPERRRDGHIFASYSRSDKDMIVKEVERIRSWGFRVWYDDNIEGSEDWNEAIYDNIRACYLTIVFLSVNSVSSQWVNREMKFATKCRKLRLPIKLSIVPDQHDLDKYLAASQYLDASMPDFAKRLLSALRKAHHLSKARGLRA